MADEPDELVNHGTVYPPRLKMDDKTPEQWAKFIDDVYRAHPQGDPRGMVEDVISAAFKAGRALPDAHTNEREELLKNALVMIAQTLMEYEKCSELEHEFNYVEGARRKSLIGDGPGLGECLIVARAVLAKEKADDRLY